MTMHDSGWKRHVSAKTCLIAGGVFIMLIALYLRTVAVKDTDFDRPFRADVVQYYITAYNLETYGVYSHILNLVDGKVSAPQPDAFLTPGYPLFLSLFVDAPPNTQTLIEVLGYQALMGTLAVLLTLLLYQRFPPWVALPAGLLTAISPHLISIGTYMLSETLFSVLLLLSLLVLSCSSRGDRWYLPSLLAGGVLLGIAALTRPVLEFFPLAVIFLLLTGYDRRTAFRGSAALLLGFVLAWTPWIARNYISLGKAGDSGNMAQTLAVGMYPDFEYEHNPRSNGEPGHLDPRFPEISRNLGAVVGEIAHRFRENPGEELRWYLIGKPVTLWSWHDVSGGPDVFTYPVFKTPYSNSWPFTSTHALMYDLHWILVLLAFFGCLVVWLPWARDWMTLEQLLLARLSSLLLLYNTAVLMVLAPFVRYSIPFLPVQYGMALIAILVSARWFILRRAGLSAADRAAGSVVRQ
ncbi:MAG TPA: hypothetical protein VFK21_02430 [Gammaproteobacteria bacterium]|nr:hypothetical protein [Gammaproteobacteria bacterium]